MQADADAPAPAPTAAHGDACGPRPQVAPPTAAAGSACGPCPQVAPPTAAAGSACGPRPQVAPPTAAAGSACGPRPQVAPPTAAAGSACGPRPQVAPPTAAAGSACGQKCVQIPDDAVMLSWRQLQWPQHCNMNADGGGAQRPPARCFCISSPRVEAGDRQDVLPPSCDRTSCCEGRLHHLEDALAACCQAQVIPALWSCGAQQTSIPAPGLHQLSVPRLISSISESGLDAKHLLPCCPPGSPWTKARPQQDVGTMTVHKELRDVGVQVGSGVTAHVFPQICLAETSQAPKPNRASGENPAPKSPVKEVKWDAEGMTWEVYGASVDPEELGLAIQKHLELQIKETASLAAKRSLQNPRASKGTRRSSRVTGLLRSATCCVRSPSAVE